MVPFNQGLAPLSARPPTPPKENTTKHVDVGDAKLLPGLANSSLLDTPDESPSSSAEYPKTSVEKAQKKVGFSGWDKFHRFPLDGSKDSDSDGSIKRLPPSKECKSFKSILKSRKDNAISYSFDEPSAFDQTNPVAMLRSTVRQLATDSRSSRIDAYVTLLGCLGAYDDIPDTADLRQQVIDLTTYIRRDISATIGLDGSLDTQIVTQVLKVLAVLICTPTMTKLLPEDFCSFIVECSINRLEDPGLPKILISHYMFLLEKQRFSARIISADRAGRILTALDSVTNRVKGIRVVCHRLMIYQRLLTQVRSVMAARVGSWIDHLISGMLSSIKDVRVRAIGFGLEASLHLGTFSSVSQACIEFLNRMSPEGKKMIQSLSSRLFEMVESKEGIHVPQVWSVVILFFRSRRRQLESWEHITAWLKVIQRCLNSSDPQVKFQAHNAWSRLIFVIDLGAPASTSMANMLRQPIVSQLERKATDKLSKQGKQTARATYCMLLYYAFRPTTPHSLLDQYWDVYIAQILPASLTASKSDISHACEILAALLSPASKPNVWNENRANMSGSVKPDDLPGIDPKWVRSRATKIIKVYEKFLDLVDLPPQKLCDTPLFSVWQSFTTAIGVASSKEIKFSMDTMNAISGIVNLLKRVLEGNIQQHSSDLSESTDRHDIFTLLFEEAVNAMGSLPFLERRLILTSQNFFEPADTPSSHSSRNSGSLNSSIMHLLKLLVMPATYERSVTPHTNAFEAVMHIPMQSAITRRGRLGHLRNMSRFLLANDVIDRKVIPVVWKLLAEAAGAALRSLRTDTYNASPQYPGHEYRDAVKILEIGIQQRSGAVLPSWLELHACVLSSLRQEIGEDGIPSLVTEPLAGAIRNCSTGCNDVLLATSVALLDDARLPQSQYSIERAQKLLRGAAHRTHKLSVDDVFINLLSMTNHVLDIGYRSVSELASPESTLTLLSSFAKWVGSQPWEYQNSILQALQGLSFWIEDSEEQMKSGSPFLTKVEEIWTLLIAIIERSPEYGTKRLAEIQHLVLSGLKSRHRAILNKSIEMWNRTFGCSEALEYSEDLQNVLLKLYAVTDIQLPSLAEAKLENVSSEKSSVASPHTYDPQTIASSIEMAELQEDDVEMKDDLHQKLPFQTNTKGLLQKAPRALTRSPNLNQATSSPLKTGRGGKTTPKARLRHDDSQIHFTAVESSPLAPEQVVSQDLTDRQKEVKERQGLDAAIFPEIRSSPKSASKQAQYSLPKLLYKADGGVPIGHAVDDQISPVYPPDALMNEFLGSSPTPTSSKKSPSRLRFDDEPPSSPPLPSTHSNVDQEKSVSPYATMQVRSPVTDESRKPHGLEKEDPADDIAKSVNLENSSANHRPLSDFVPDKGISEPNDHIMSDADIFVDAPSAPNEELVPTEAAAQIDMVLNSFETDKQSQTQSEADQLTAQLFGEMERASSQQTRKKYQTIQPAQIGRKKRKGSFSNHGSIQKKAKAMPGSSGSQRVSEPTQVAECVLVQVRPAEGRFGKSPVQIKRERSQSPSFIANTPLENDARISKQRRKRRSRQSRISQLSQESSSILESSQQNSRELNASMNETSNSTSTGSRKSMRLSGTPTNTAQQAVPRPVEDPIAEPGSMTKTGKRRASKRWFWTNVEPSDDEIRNNGTPRDDANANVDDAGQSEHTQQLTGETQTKDSEARDRDCQDPTTDENTPTSQPEQAETEASNNAPTTAAGILQGFRRMLTNIKRVALGREEEREMIGVLSESLQEVLEAGRRR
ncbi:hypothetical protein ACLMJK_006043 [Lecanora helva]